MLVDPAVGTADAANAVDWFDASADGALVAVGTSEGGTEDSVLRVLDAADGRDLGEAIPNTRACSVAWEPDGSGFAYTRYPEGDQYHRTVHHHRLGDRWRGRPGRVGRAPQPAGVAERRRCRRTARWLLVHVQVGWARVDVHLLDRATGTWTTVVEGVEATSAFQFAADGDVARRRHDARRAAGPGRAGAARRRAADAGRLDDARRRGRGRPVRPAGVGRRAARRRHDRGPSTPSRRYDADGRSLGDRSTGSATSSPSPGCPPTAPADRRSSSSTRSTRRRRCGASATAAPPSRWSAPAAAATRRSCPTSRSARSTYPSLDGTPIGLFLIHRADVVPGPDVPAILNGYGGFAISETPVWSPQIAAWCAAGGMYAIAGLRGGLEEGEAWHHAGRRAHKQNVFDDFHAAADWLVERGHAGRDRLAVLGGSNGGLLVGVAMTQRPDLCRAVWCGVPLLDMVRFPQFLIARLWTSEYGDPDVAEEFAWLHAYSPYHHVVEGTCYPATLFTTAEGDTRVDPLHARKMAALVQAASPCQDERPILLFQEGRAGHGVGKPVAKRADELADGLTFLAWQLGLDPARRDR